MPTDALAALHQIGTGHLPGFDPGRATATAKSSLKQVAQTLDYAFMAGANTEALLHARTRAVDTVLIAIWKTYEWPSDTCMIALGGYGRGELHPHSDIDLMILCQDDPEQHRESIERFVTSVWDSGLQLGHSVRTVDACLEEARNDITVLTNLMEARVLVGQRSLMNNVTQGIGTQNMWPSDTFFKAKLQEQNERHDKFADTEYNLEPNVKSSPGGLRDLQIICWIIERHFSVTAKAAFGVDTLLTSDEQSLLEEGRDFMWRVRYALHMLSKRPEDRLLFDHQRQIAELWGLTDDKERLAVEQFMQLYYRWALTIAQINDVLIQYFEQHLVDADNSAIETINERFSKQQGYLNAVDLDIFRTQPTAILEAFLICAQREDIADIGARTLRAISDHRDLVDDTFRQNPVHKAMFLEFLRSPYQITRMLRRMTRYGFLGNYLPEFGKIIGQMQHDLFHTYTVDAHTLELIQNIRRFLTGNYEEKFPVSSRVARRLPKKELIYIAGLYHDIGKGRGGDHSELGAVDAEQFCRNHGLSERDTSLVTWLVKNHLLMSAVSQRKDISDPDVIQQFAIHVGDQQRLDYLFTLTVADINATNPTLWNAWRSSLLRQLHTEAKRALRRGLENPVDKNEWIKETREAAIKLLEYRGFTPEELDDLWLQRGDDYFLRERAEDIAWHTEAIAGHHDQHLPLVLAKHTNDSSVANATQVFIHARSRPHLFSLICAALEQLDLSIHDARIYGASGGMTLDTFFVLDSSGETIEHDAQRTRHVIANLTRALKENAKDSSIANRRTPRQFKSFSIPTRASITQDKDKGLSILEVISPDRPGLLARLGKVFVEFGIEVQTAKIQTLGERVEDLFFITDAHQNPITDPAICEQIETAIRDTLDSQVNASA